MNIELALPLLLHVFTDACTHFHQQNLARQQPRKRTKTSSARWFDTTKPMEPFCHPYARTRRTSVIWLRTWLDLLRALKHGNSNECKYDHFQCKHNICNKVNDGKYLPRHPFILVWHKRSNHYSLHPLPVNRYGGERKKRDAMMRPPRYRISLASDKSRLDSVAHKQDKAIEHRLTLRLQCEKM